MGQTVWECIPLFITSVVMAAFCVGLWFKGYSLGRENGYKAGYEQCLGEHDD